MVKTITVSDEVYRVLLSAKRKNESFSKLLERLVQCNGSQGALKKIAGSIDFEDGEKEHMLSEIYSKRAERRTL